jgi:regulator of sigma E protease
MHTVLTVILFILMLSIIIVIHEWGHYIAAKSFGVYVYEFSIGMGPAIWKKKKGETQYSIRALPLGGFTAMAGEVDGDEAYPDVKVPDERRLINIAWWKKVIILLAGVFMNFLLGWIIFSLVLLSYGSFRMSAKPVVESVNAGSPAAEAGFEAGDRIVKIVKEDGTSIEPESFLEMQSFITDGSQLTVTVDRDNEEVTLTVTPQYSKENEAYLIGISGAAGELVDVNLANCWYYGGYEMIFMFRMLASAIGALVHGTGMQNLSGPVGVYQATSTMASYGVASYLFFVAEISVNVGVFNLLPLPVLDGGQVIITLAEAIVRHRLSTKVRMALILISWGLLILLMLAVTWQDVSRLITG